MTETLTDTSGETTSATVESAQRQILDMRMDPSHPLNNPNDPRHGFATKDVERLYEAIDRMENPKPPEEKPLVNLPTVQGAPPTFAWDVAEVNRQARLFERFGIGHGEFETLFHGLIHRAQAIGSGKERRPDGAATLEQLRSQWGESFDSNLAAAQLFAEVLPEDTKRFLRQTGLADDAGIVRRMAAAGAKLVPLYQRKTEIEEDDDFGGHLGTNMTRHAALVEERKKIMRQLAGEERP